MKHGIIKVAAASPSIRVADVSYNTQRIIDLINKAQDECVHVLALPELCITGATCQDLFLQKSLTTAAMEAIAAVAEAVPRNMVVIYGSPVKYNGRLYDCSIAATDGKVIAVIPVNSLDSERRRWFSEYYESDSFIDISDYCVRFSPKVILSCTQLPSFTISCSENEQANIIVCSDAKPAFAGMHRQISDAVKFASATLNSGVIYANASEGESTSDGVYSSDLVIAENNEILKDSSFCDDTLVITELDLEKIEYDKEKNNRKTSGDFFGVSFNMEIGDTVLTREISTSPFIPQDIDEQNYLASQIIKLQSKGLQKRLLFTHSKSAVIGISGGLDSTLALLVAVDAFDSLKRDRKEIICVTMPCFGTTARTKTNAEILVEKLGCTLRTIDIASSVKQHFADIGHSGDKYDAAYENAQARERTQILMDISNMESGLVVGTGDLSELALGWATYNGDHMSSYGVNAGVPKTLVKLLVRYTADSSSDEVLKSTLYSILDTPISPELVPGKQETEDLVGPYELHDFFIYYFLRFGFSLSKILRLAEYAFEDIYDKDTIVKWLRTFCRRFFSQQFKRSCLPDGPAVLDISLSPRGGWKMPSDAYAAQWNKELEDSLNN